MKSEYSTSLLSDLWVVLAPYWRQDKKKQAWTLLVVAALLIVLLALVNAFKTYITKWAINALTDKHAQLFYHILELALAFLVISAVIEALHVYYREKLGLFWRKWFNNNMLDRYFKNRSYLNVALYSDVDNPDQRIAEDIAQFSTLGNMFASSIFLSVLSFVTYISVLYTMSPTLMVVLIAYATLGSAVVLLISRALARRNFFNLKYQANYRYNLIHTRDSIESIAFYRGEAHEKSLLKKTFNIVFANYVRLIKIQRNISFVSKLYILLAPLFVFLILAPAILAGKMQIGSLVQGVDIFTSVLMDLSFIVLQFNQLSTFAAVIRRLAQLTRAVDVEPPASSTITTKSSPNMVFDDLTVETPDLSKTLVKHLNFELKPGCGTLIVGPSGCGKSSLLRAVAGLWQAGSGTILRPDMRELMFLPQKPYMIIGNLRDQLTYPANAGQFDDAVLQQALIDVNLPTLLERVNGFDAIMPWSDLLSLGEQQRIIFLRLFLNQPKIAILDESTSALDEPNEAMLYQRLKASGVTYLSVGHRSSLIPFHDYVLALDDQQGWKFYTREQYLQTF